jgi:hypothetical protein
MSTIPRGPPNVIAFQSGTHLAYCQQMSAYSSTSFWDTLIRVFLIFGIPWTTWKILPLQTNWHSTLNSLPYSRITHVLQNHMCYVGISSYFACLFHRRPPFYIIKIDFQNYLQPSHIEIYDMWNVWIKGLYNAGRPFYGVPDDGKSHGMSQRIQAFSAVKVSRSETR